MAVTETTRLGATRWSDGTDPFNRTQLDTTHQNLEDRVAGFLIWNSSSGTPARPAAAAAYNMFYAYDRATGDMTVCVDIDGAGNYQWVSYRAYKESMVTMFAREGTLVVASGKGRFRAPYDLVIEGVSATVNTPPTGASVIVDVDRAAAATPGSWSTIYSTQANRPAVAASAYHAAETVPDITSIATGDFLRANVAQVGSTIAGADLTVLVRYRRA